MTTCSHSLLCLLPLLLCGLLGGRVLSICPSVCSCSGGHRVVDCSLRGLNKFPSGLQHNIRFLNLSFNSLRGLDSQLSHYTHLRTLDLSYNSLESLPPLLPRSLWDIRAAGNHLRLLDKNDTAYHWNLKVLDLSENELERVVFINNTLLSLKALNLSQNRFWTVPTNLPHNLESIDLSHNYLVQILPRSLDRLPMLAKFYLHANRFTWLSKGIFDKLTGLKVITLGGNPWACEEENTTSLLRWAEQTRATVLGCPCHTRPICGQTHVASTGSKLSFGLFTDTPFWVNSRGERHDWQPPARTAGVTSGYQAKSALVETGIYQDIRGMDNYAGPTVFVWMESTSFDNFSIRSSTTANPQSLTKMPNVANSQNKGCRLLAETKETIILTIAVMRTGFTTF
ncbi:oligodendrocyte-myelin glycoprotein isoform X2 [Mugil cephalus]|nr:oligodendrocyte-myelin glycoprotein isoform X2 [Mugil cephalus]